VRRHSTEGMENRGEIILGTEYQRGGEKGRLEVRVQWARGGETDYLSETVGGEDFWFRSLLVKGVATEGNRKKRLWSNRGERTREGVEPFNQVTFKQERRREKKAPISSYPKERMDFCSEE